MQRGSMEMPYRMVVTTPLPLTPSLAGGLTSA